MVMSPAVGLCHTKVLSPGYEGDRRARRRGLCGKESDECEQGGSKDADTVASKEEGGIKAGNGTPHIRG